MLRTDRCKQVINLVVLLASLTSTSSSSDQCASGIALTDRSCRAAASTQDGTQGNALLQLKSVASKHASATASQKQPGANFDDDDDGMKFSNNNNNGFTSDNDAPDNNNNGFTSDNNDPPATFESNNNDPPATFQSNNNENEHDFGNGDKPLSPTPSPEDKLAGVKGAIAEVIAEEVRRVKREMAAPEIVNMREGITKVGRIVATNQKYLNRLFQDVHGAFDGEEEDNDNGNNSENNNNDNDNDNDNDNGNNNNNGNEDDNDNDDGGLAGTTMPPTTIPPTTTKPKPTAPPPKNSMDCFAYCYFALKCSGKCSSLGDMGNPPNCAVNGQSQCQGQYPGGGSFSQNGPQCQCQCGGFSVEAGKESPAIGFHTLWSNKPQVCNGNPARINGKQYGNLGQFDPKNPAGTEQCKQACLSSNSCVFAAYQRKTGGCTGYTSCGPRNVQGDPYDVYHKKCN